MNASCFNTPMCGYVATCPDCYGCDDCCDCALHTDECRSAFGSGYCSGECRLAREAPMCGDDEDPSWGGEPHL